MSYADASGVKLYYEEAGSGTPVLFVHEFAGDHRSWEPQMRHFARTNRAITYSARGYPPSDVPDDLDLYGQDIARDDILAVMDHLGLERAHIVGLSMGGFAAVHFGIHFPERALSLVVSGCGYGAPKGAQSHPSVAGQRRVCSRSPVYRAAAPRCMTWKQNSASFKCRRCWLSAMRMTLASMRTHG